DEPQVIDETASTDQAPSDSVSQPVDAPVVAEAPVQNPQAAAAAPGEGVLELRYTADCWTQVTDADGRVLLSVLAKAGTSRTVSGKAPLDLRLGYASGAQVTYNGEAVSLSGQTRGETARLQLGQQNMHSESPIKRRHTRKIWVGSVPVGGDAPIAVQSMTNTETCDVDATVAQIQRLQDAGADIVRVSVPSMDAAEAFGKIKQRVQLPLVADIHFDYQ